MAIVGVELAIKKASNGTVLMLIWHQKVRLLIYMTNIIGAKVALIWCKFVCFSSAKLALNLPH
uniref:Uncharacterized protein n=1 Tax=Pseudoalteromonas rubra TaxID=43658 RepID=A0A0F4QYT5_9GAMM|nr:hypothetical protein TW77_04170 [Pseudoalteromonas rubra]